MKTRFNFQPQTQKTITVCYKCTDRKPGCHDYCSLYKMQREEFDKMKEKKRSEKFSVYNQYMHKKDRVHGQRQKGKDMELKKKLAFVYENGYLLKKDDIVTIEIQVGSEETGQLSGRVEYFDEDTLVLDCSSGYVSDVKKYHHSHILNIFSRKS